MGACVFITSALIATKQANFLHNYVLFETISKLRKLFYLVLAAGGRKELQKS